MADRKIEFPSLLYYQKPVVKALENKSAKYVTFLASRRIGKSLIAKCMAVRWCLSESRINVGFIVPTGTLAVLFIKEIVQNLNGSGAILASNVVQKTIQFANGSGLYFHSAEAWGRGAGKYKYLIFDECAFLDEETYNSIFQPWTLEAKKIYFCSTPCGVGGVFYDMYHKGLAGNRRYQSYQCTLEESGLYDSQTITEIKESTPKRIYLQEYCCEFLTGGISCFPNFEERLTPDGVQVFRSLFAGIDFSGAANGTDSTVLTIVNENCQMVAQHIFSHGDTRTLEEMARIMNTMGVKHCFGEENSMGAISIEIIKKTFKKITGFVTTNDTKRNIVENVIKNFEQHKGSIIDNPTNRLQFGNFIEDRTRTGKITYRNIRDGVHDDTVISYCLACWSAKQHSRSGTYFVS